MLWSTARLSLLVAGLLFSMAGPSSRAQHPQTAVEELRQNLLVVYNKADSDSLRLARQYVKARGLADSQLLGIECPVDTEITRPVFKETIWEPIRSHCLENGLIEVQPGRVNFGNGVRTTESPVRSNLWALVLVRGIPLKISRDDSITADASLPSQFQRNEAAVDSELSLIGFSDPEITGFVPNPYYSDTSLRPFSSEFARQAILVCRLDGPKPQDVERMIRDSVAVENIELTGRAVFDNRGITDRSSGYLAGDIWIREAESIARNAGFEVFSDSNGAVIEATQPLEDIALYAGWYTGSLSGPFARPGFSFRPGAVAYHLHSYSAQQLRNPSKRWAGPLIARGAAATMGSVYEPYLRFTPHVPVFLQSLLNGQTFAEAAYQSQPVLSWTITMIGDPLYRPFPRKPLENAQRAQTVKGESESWMCLRIARLICNQSISEKEKIQRVGSMVRALPNAITIEGFARILMEMDADAEIIMNLFREAEAKSSTPAGKIRSGLEVANLLAKRNRIEEAMAEFERLLATYPEAAPQFGVPDTALALAGKTGWQQLSPAMQAYLAPVEEAKDPSPSPAAPPAVAPALPKPRKDLIPRKPSFAPPKPGQGQHPPQHQNPNILPIPGSPNG